MSAVTDCGARVVSVNPPFLVACSFLLPRRRAPQHGGGPSRPLYSASAFPAPSAAHLRGCCTGAGESSPSWRRRVRPEPASAQAERLLYHRALIGALESGLVRTMEDAIVVLRRASQPLWPMGDDWLRAQVRSVSTRTSKTARLAGDRASGFTASFPFGPEAASPSRQPREGTERAAGIALGRGAERYVPQRPSLHAASSAFTWPTSWPTWTTTAALRGGGRPRARRRQGAPEDERAGPMAATFTRTRRAVPGPTS
jgi:hypothetical protein